MDKKIKRKIKSNNRLIAILILRKDDRSVDKVIKTIQNKYCDLENFFNMKIPTINVELIYSRKEMDNKYGHKTPNWMVGFANKEDKNYIYIISPSACEKISDHKENAIYKVIVHEMSHIFINKINRSTLNWLNEGLSLYLASQLKKNEIKKENWDFLIKNNFFTDGKNWSIFTERQGYEISYSSVNFLMENYGKNKILELIKINKRSEATDKKIYQILRIRLENLISQIQKQIKFR